MRPIDSLLVVLMLVLIWTAMAPTDRATVKSVGGAAGALIGNLISGTPDASDLEPLPTPPVERVPPIANNLVRVDFLGYNRGTEGAMVFATITNVSKAPLEVSLDMIAYETEDGRTLHLKAEEQGGPVELQPGIVAPFNSTIDGLEPGARLVLIMNIPTEQPIRLRLPPLP